MSIVIRAVTDHAAKEIIELRAKRAELLAKVGEIGREIATLESYATMAGEHAAAEAANDSKSGDG